MEQFKDLIEQERKRLKHIVDEMSLTLAQEQEDRHKLTHEISELKQQKLEAVSWKEKQEIDDLIASCRQRYQLRHYQDAKALRRPYFGVMELDDDDLGKLSYCLGAQSFFDRNNRILVIDWRDAPISRLYYEYNAGEAYEEDIRDKERSGIVKTKRQTDTTGGVLRKISENGYMLICDENGVWKKAGGTGKTLSDKEEKADHRLPEITALISSKQFQTITQPQTQTILLQGGAGSGKTTVGLHRAAYLAYQNPERFKPERMLIVMFNRSLQKYISRVLPDLGAGSGVLVETYHRWASKLFHAAKTQITYNPETPSSDILRIKKHAIMLALTDAYLKNLLMKSRQWFLEQLKEHHDPDIDRIKKILRSVNSLDVFLQTLETHPIFSESPQPDSRDKLRLKLLNRLNDHEADLHAALSDPELLAEVFLTSHFSLPSLIRRFTAWQTKLRDKHQIDFADTGILLWMMQRKGIKAALPDYAHIMVDEAQDLSEVELATLLYAADKEQSVTICGDMAQKIKTDVSFSTPEGFTGFIREIQNLMGVKEACAETLNVGYRATRPIMELAWHVLNHKPLMTVPRNGDPVKIIRTQNYEETLTQSFNILKNYIEKRPNALIGVICRYKTEADRVFQALKRFRLTSLRRHERDDFSFQPGIVVTNAHQVKGLEFSAILIINPDTGQYRDNPQNRMLLHMVITRASDHLWIIGHQPIAYGIEKWSH